MDFVIDYDVAAVFLLIVLLAVYRTKKHLGVRLNRIFLAMTVSLLLVDIMDIVTVLVSRMDQPAAIWLNYLLNILLFLFQVFMYTAFFVFVLTLIEYKEKVRRNLIFALCFLSSLYMLLIVSTPLTRLVFYFTENSMYQYGALHSVVYVLPCFTIALSFFMLISRRSHIKKMQSAAVCLYTGMILGSTIFQSLFMPHVLFAYFFSSLGILVVYLTFQSPEYYLDSATDAFNEAGLYEILKESCLMKKPCYLVVLYPLDIELICGSKERSSKDKVMQSLARYLESVPFGESSVYRLNEVMCVLTRNEKNAVEAAKKVHKDFLEKRVRFNKEIPLSANMLLLHSPGNFLTFDEAMSFVRYFCQETSKNPKQDMITCDEEYIKKKKRYDQIIEILKNAIRTEDISICYQPIYSQKEKQFYSAEALVRLNDTATLGTLSPDEFIPIAEKENLIFDLENIILKKIFAFVKKYQIWEHGVRYMEINLSARQCLQIDLCEKIEALLKQFQLEPSFFNFELTETAIIESKEQVLRNMEKLIELGCTTALDDFGSGYANINYLMAFPFHIIKLDKELVWSYFYRENEKSKIVLENIISTLNILNLKIVAEGIESKVMSESMEDVGIHDFQGYYYSRPLEEDKYLKFLMKETGR